MTTPDYVVKPMPGHRIKYLLLTVVPPTVVMYLIRYLIDSGIIPDFDGMSSLLLLIPLAGMWYLANRFLFRKNHSVAVYAHYMVEIDLRQKERRISFDQVHTVKTNLLGETVVKDAKGKMLLCIEENMENRERLMNRLRSLVE
ncbi:MAG: hypothetical protein J6R33_00935 [Clostridia bacterium]|nr:hypothetical protein [Clostridia bacterium]